MSEEQFDPAHAMALHDRLMWMANGWPLKVSADEIVAKTDELRNYLNKAAPQPPADMKPLPPEIGEIVAQRLGDMQEGPSYEVGEPEPTDKIVLPPLPRFKDMESAVLAKAYGAACRAAALEECAKVADDFHGDCVKPRKHLSPAGLESYRGGAIVAENIAAAIRALKEVT